MGSHQATQWVPTVPLLRHPCPWAWCWAWHSLPAVHPNARPCWSTPNPLPPTQGQGTGAKGLCGALVHTGMCAPALPALTGDGEQHPIVPQGPALLWSSHTTPCPLPCQLSTHKWTGGHKPVLYPATDFPGMTPTTRSHCPRGQWHILGACSDPKSCMGCSLPKSCGQVQPSCWARCPRCGWHMATATVRITHRERLRGEPWMCPPQLQVPLENIPHTELWSHARAPGEPGTWAVPGAG